MKEKPSEWIVIADLMSGVVAVVMLMLVVSVVQKQVAEKRHKAELTQGAEAQRQRIASVLGQMQSAFAQEGASSYIAIDAAAGKVTLKERAFRSGSACIEPEAKAAFDSRFPELCLLGHFFLRHRKTTERMPCVLRQNLQKLGVGLNCGVRLCPLME